MNFFEDNITALTMGLIIFVLILLSVNSRGKKRKEMEKEMEAIRNTRANYSFVNTPDFSEVSYDSQIPLEKSIEDFDYVEVKSYNIDHKSTTDAPRWQKTTLKYNKYSDLTNKSSLITAVLKEENKPLTAYDIKCIYSENFENITTPKVRQLITKLKQEGIVVSNGKRKDENSNHLNSLWELKK